MEPVKRFEQLTAWEKAHQWVVGVYSLTRAFPEDERFGLTSQLRRAAASVPTNIVEGFNRMGVKDKLKFYNTAVASLEEARYLLLLADELRYADTQEHRADAEEISRILHGLTAATRRRL